MPPKNFQYEQVDVVLNSSAKPKVVGSLAPRPCAALRRLAPCYAGKHANHKTWYRETPGALKSQTLRTLLYTSRCRSCPWRSCSFFVFLLPGKPLAAHLRRSSAKAHGFTSAMLSCASLARSLRHRAQPKPLFWGRASTLFDYLTWLMWQILEPVLARF